MPVLTTATAATVAGWTFAFSPYLWAPGVSSSVDTRFGTLSADASVGDVVSSTNFALMGLVEARSGRWGLIADLVYTDLTERNDTPFGVLFSEARIDTRLTMASLYSGYRVYETPQVAVDLLAGARSISMDIDVSLSPGALLGRSFGLSEDWVDPLVGGRVRVDFAERWFTTLFADVGGFDGDSDSSWQAVAILGYQFDDRWSVQGGWRQLSIEKEIEGRDTSLDLGGPLIGFTARF
jgi:hypothetical protein